MEKRDNLISFIESILMPAGFERNNDSYVNRIINRGPDQLLSINGISRTIPGRQSIMNMKCRCDGPNYVETRDCLDTRQYFELVGVYVDIDEEVICNVSYSIYYDDDYESEIKELFNHIFNIA